MKHKEILKEYRSYPGAHKYGVRCKYNMISQMYPLHRHDYIEFEYVVRGRGIQELNGIEHSIERGGFVCLNRKDLHRFSVSEPLELHNICMDYKNVPSAVRHMLTNISFPVIGRLCESDLERLDAWFKMLMCIIESEEKYCEQKITAYTLLILSSMMENAVQSTAKSPKGGYRYVSVAMDYIEQHYAEDIRLGDVAMAVSLSMGHFSKLFSKISGMSFSEYLTLVRVQKARVLLAETDKSVTEIAFECGFGSFSAFSRSFKRLNGCNPVNYRNNCAT